MAKDPGKSKDQNLLGGFLLGAAIGTLGGLLLAPRSGRETREQLKIALGDLSQLTESLTLDLQSQAERLSDQALQRWEDTLNRLREAIVAGIEASQAEARNQAHSMAHADTITVPAHPEDSPTEDWEKPLDPSVASGQESLASMDNMDDVVPVDF